MDKYETEFQKNNAKVSESKIKKIRKEKKEEITDEIKIYIGLLYELFNQQLFDKSKSYIELLKYKLINFSKMMLKYFIKNFFLAYRKYLIFLKKLFFGKLKSTHNKLENSFGNTRDKDTKIIYRTQKEYLIISWREKLRD